MAQFIPIPGCILLLYTSMRTPIEIKQKLGAIKLNIVSKKQRKVLIFQRKWRFSKLTDYVLVLMEEVVKVRLQLGSCRNSRINRDAAMRNYLTPIAESYPHVPMTELVERHVCRFNKKWRLLPNWNERTVI